MHASTYIDDPVNNLSIMDVYEIVVGMNARSEPMPPMNPRKYRVQCPVKAHRDSNPSCYLFPDTNGWFCYGCKKKGGKFQLVMAYGAADDQYGAANYLRSMLGVQQVLRPQPAGIFEGGIEKPWLAQPGERLIVYPYYNERGGLMYEAMRFEGPIEKRFMMRVPDPSKSFGYSYSMQGQRRVPYNLPQVLRACAERRVILDFEGEKKAKRVRQLGFTTTTNHGGCGAADFICQHMGRKWASYFDGAYATVHFTDADDVGRERAHGMARILARPDRPAVVIDLFPDLNDGSDIEDFLDAHPELDPAHFIKSIIAQELRAQKVAA